MLVCCILLILTITYAIVTILAANITLRLFIHRAVPKTPVTYILCAVPVSACVFYVQPCVQKCMANLGASRRRKMKVPERFHDAFSRPRINLVTPLLTLGIVSCSKILSDIFFVSLT
jgi:hypothetical protein